MSSQDQPDDDTASVRDRTGGDSPRGPLDQIKRKIAAVANAITVPFTVILVMSLLDRVAYVPTVRVPTITGTLAPISLTMIVQMTAAALIVNRMMRFLFSSPWTNKTFQELWDSGVNERIAAWRDGVFGADSPEVGDDLPDDTQESSNNAFETERADEEK